jgi:RHS repeat-associated protein
MGFIHTISIPKISLLVVMGTLSILPAASAPGADANAVPGDANGDGTVDIRDVQSIYRVARNSALKVTDEKNADVNQDGKIDEEDGQALALHLNGQSTLIVRTRVPYGRPRRFQIGDIIRIEIADRFQPLDIKCGSIHIRSEITRYDSGDLPLTHEQNGRVVYFHWSTARLEPAGDYEIDIAVVKGDETRKTTRTQISLWPVIIEQIVLHRARDLYLPYWGIGLTHIRNYCYESGYHSYKGPFGLGWIHGYDVSLTESTDGSISFYDSSGVGRTYQKVDIGSYSSPPGDASTLFRDPDGTFGLLLPNGSLWRFDPRLGRCAGEYRPIYFQDVQGHQINLHYDKDKRLAQIRDGAGQSISFAYDTQGLITHASDSTGREVAYEYTSDGLLYAVVNERGEPTEYEYDQQKRLSHIYLPDKRNVYYTYHPDNRLESMYYDEGCGKVRYGYNLSNSEYGERTIADAEGRMWQEKSHGDCFVFSVQDPAGAETSFEYSDFHLKTVHDPEGHTWHLVTDSADNINSVTDPEGHITRLSYTQPMHHGKVVTGSLPTNRPVQLVDGNGIKTEFEYMENGLPTRTIYADGTTEILYYEARSDGLTVTREMRNRQRICYELDDRGLLRRKIMPDGSIWQYTYNNRGELLTASNDWGTIRFEYNPLSRPTKIVYPGGRTFTFEYDAVGRRTKMVDPDGRILTYIYGSAGQLQVMRENHMPTLVAYDYNLALQVIRKTYANGTLTHYSYDSAGRLVAIKHLNANETVISEWQYTYDKFGRVIRRAGPEGEDRYVLDKTGQVMEAALVDGVKRSVHYDAAHNREKTVEGDKTTTFSVNVLNQYTAIGDELLQYDLNGNLALRRSFSLTTSYVHDAEGRLIAVHLPDGRIITYHYNALGQLAERKEGSKTSRFLWVGPQITIEEDASYNTQRTFTWGGHMDEAICLNQGYKSFFYHQDMVQSVTEVSSDTGSVVATCRYGLFGEITSAIGKTLEQPFGFTGALHDKTSGLVYLRNRWYAPKLGRFLQPDPIGIRGGSNLYAYAFNNPLTFVDRLGLTGGSAGSRFPTTDPRDLNRDGKYDFWDGLVWIFGRLLWNLMTPPTMPNPTPGFGDDGPGSTNSPIPGGPTIPPGGSPNNVI